MQEIFNRVSVRAFSEHKVEPEKIESLMKAAMGVCCGDRIRNSDKAVRV